MKHIAMKYFGLFLKDESGSTMIEYAFISVAFVLAGFVAVSQLGADGSNLYESITESVLKGLNDGLTYSKSY